MINLYLLDPITDKAHAILLSNNISIVNSIYDADIIYTQLTPITTTKPVFSPCTGVDHISSPHITHLDQHWRQTQGKSVTSTAEHTFSLILQLAKQKHMQLYGKTLGIIGQGRIGSMVTEYALNFGMSVIAIDPLLSNVHRLQTLLNESDIITIHVPYSEDTHHLISHKQLDNMRHNVILVNTSRPNIVDTTALPHYFDTINLSYGNDFDQFPHHPNVIATSHVAGNSIDARIQTDIYIANKICEYVNNVIHTPKSSSNLDQTTNI